MNKKEKLQKIVAGEKVNKLSASFWRHFYKEEQDIDALAQALVSFQDTYHWDFIKINPRTSYYSEDWGCAYQYNDIEKPKRISSAIKYIDDWAAIEPLHVEEGVLGEHVKLVRKINYRVKDHVPIIQTLYLPMEIAAGMCLSRFDLKRHLKENPALLEKAFENITETFIAYAKECVHAGADGFFLASKCATKEYLSDEEFTAWHKRFDMRLLNSIRKEARFLILHLCGAMIRLDQMLDYPVDILHWDSTIRDNPALKDVHNNTDKVIMGGVSNFDLSTLSPERLQKTISQISFPNRWILSAECILEPTIREQNLHTIAKLIRD
ncbi:MAG: hypothetical protein A2Y62_09270 [Candidatus Fischerbacteria bacterium RBG_13_37_8]|uniref:Uroporphyrinogen decarboxylase (URO-D) domain-containing protein n=1 Tax=Candidatus Fischerbacteria bacterium RBG_13_37_8 TaxID=1817863 RepID=A0A1F5VEC7_9BACT|nr:MAG: hypothetical protein A2Y62_09270 [Candidatus Fischerbacteria bacterium RBG_13_37_8]